MRQFILFISVLLLSSCNTGSQNGSTDTDLVNNTASAEGRTRGELPDISFKGQEHDFGRITQGERVRHEFNFTNSGNGSLLISDARGSCGCTVPEWPKEPIPPGGNGTIKVEFNSEGKSGLQEKTITIVTNGEPATRVLRIKADIVVAETAK